MMRDDLLNMLVCPETKQPVALAARDLVEKLNVQIRAGTLHDRGGERVEQPIEAGLVRQDGQILYPVVDDIPRMLVERGILLDPTTTGGS